MSDTPGAGRLEPETLAAYIDGLLPDDERAKVEAEIAADPESYEWVVSAMSAVDDPSVVAPARTPETVAGPPPAPASPAPEPRSEPQPAPSPAPGPAKVLPFYRRRTVQGLSALLLASAAALVLMVNPSYRAYVLQTPDEARLVAKLVEAVGEERYIEARLTGGYKYGPLRPVSRGPADARERNLSLLAAAGELQRTAQKNSGPALMGALGGALVLLDDLDTAITTLEKASGLPGADADVFVNLSAAYLARAQRGGPANDYPKALEAAERAILLEPDLPEALYDKALALESIGLSDRAATAWEAFLRVDSNSAWARDAQTRLAALKQTGPRSRLVPDASAPQCILDAWTSVESAQIDRLRATLAGCTAESTVHNEWLQFLNGVADYYAGRHDSADAALSVALSTKRPSTAIRGRLKYLRASFAFARGDLGVALAEAADAAHIAESFDDAEGLAAAYQLAAEVTRTSGTSTEAWRYYVSALSAAGQLPASLRVYSLYNSLALAAIADEMPLAAIELLAAGRSRATGPARPVQLTENSMHAARAYAAAGLLIQAGDALSEARESLKVIGDASLRLRLIADLGLAHAELLWSTAPIGALAGSGAAVTAFQSLGISHKLAMLHLYRAKALRSLGYPSQAGTELDAGLARVTLEQHSIDDGRLRITHADRLWDLFRDRADLYVASGADEAALRLVDRGRALAARLPQTNGSVTPDYSVSSDTEVISYLWLSSGLGRWTTTAAGTRFDVVETDQGRVSELRERLMLELAARTKGGAASRALGSLLIPADVLVHSRLAIVPDGDLAMIPFGLLAPDANGTTVVWDTSSVALTSSMVGYAAAVRGYRRTMRSVAAASFDGAGSELPVLPAADREAREIRAQYQNGTISTGHDTTASSVVAMARTADVLHFAGHSVGDSAAPWRSRLIVAGTTTGTADWLRLDYGSTRDFRSIVVLAACSSAAGPPSRTQGVLSLATVLLGRGAPAVVAPMTDIADEASVETFAAVHSMLAKGDTPSDALRYAYLNASADSFSVVASLVAFGY